MIEQPFQTTFPREASPDQRRDWESAAAEALALGIKIYADER